MNKTVIIGYISHHQWGAIYGGGGLAPALQRVNYKEPVKVMVEERPYPANNKDGFLMVKEGDGVVAIRPDKCGKPVQDGISPTLNTYKGCGSGVVVKQVLTRKRTEFGKMVRKQYENGQINLSRNDMTELEPRGDGLSNTITTIKKDNMLIEGMFMDTNVNQAAVVYNPEGVSPVVLASGNATGSKIKIVDDKNNETELAEGDVAAMHTPGRAEKRQNGPRFNDGRQSFTITAADKDGIAQNENGDLRIRYLTPRECLRLQAFPDDVIDKLLEVESKSQCYKLAGNSIAVCCLKAIFKGIYVDKTFKNGSRQVSLNKWF